jgi:ferredoxin
VSANAGDSVKVIINQDVCSATGECTRTAPKVFDIPEDSDTAVVMVDLVTDPEQIALVEEAAQFCPTGSISLQRI